MTTALETRDLIVLIASGKRSLNFLEHAGLDGALATEPGAVAMGLLCVSVLTGRYRCSVTEAAYGTLKPVNGFP